MGEENAFQDDDGMGLDNFGLQNDDGEVGNEIMINEEDDFMHQSKEEDLEDEVDIDKLIAE